jgi:NNP family nitrate/nitrite transporter-like MFS transporter
MPVLFEEISADLGLSLLEIGTVWGMIGLAGVFVALVGGVLGDRFGVKLVLGLACLLGGLAGASRGLSTDFVSLAATVFAFGLIRAIIPINVHKAVSILFQGGNLGTANGAVSMGMGIGLMLGPMISATVLSPLLGSWRYVLFLYGAASIVVGILWLLSGRMPQPSTYSTSRSGAVPMREAIPKLMRIKTLWLMGLTLMLRMGCITGMVGYLPLYLRKQGWTITNADGTLAGFYAISTLCVIPLSLLSDRIGSRKSILFAALITAIFGVGLIPVMNGIAVWILVLATGIFMDAFMAVTFTLVQETRGVGPRYSGTALGLVFTFSQLGAFVSPPLGNSLANFSSGLPLLFWASLSLVAIIALIFAEETGQKLE